MAGAERQAEAIVNTRGGLVGKIEEHHVFPREFEGYFRDKGIDIHQYALPLDREAHKVAHAKGKHFEDWNQRWNKWIADNPGATEHQVFEQAGKMMDEYGLSFSPLKNYRRRR